MFFRKLFFVGLSFFMLGHVLHAKSVDCSKKFAPIVASDIVTFVPYFTQACQIHMLMEKFYNFALDEYDVAVPTLQDYQDLGIHGVNAYNIGKVNNTIAVGFPDAVESVSKIQALVNRVVAKLNKVGRFTDVKGVSYKTSSGLSGVTGENGEFEYRDGDDVSFYVAEAKIGELKANESIEIYDLKNPLLVSQVLHSLDSDANASNGFNLSNLSSKINSRSFRKQKNYALNISELDLYDEKYKIFLTQHSQYIVPSSKSVAIDLLNKVKEKMAQNTRTRPGYSGAVNIMKGQYNFPFANNSTIKFYAEKNYRENKYLYRVQLASAYRVYLENIQEIAVASKGKIDEAKELEDRVKKFEAKMQFGLNSAIDIIDYKNDKDVKKLITSIGKNTLNTAIDTMDDETYQPEVKLAATLLIDVTTISSKSDAINVAANAISNSLDIFVRDTLAQEYPVGSQIVKDVSNIIIDNAVIYATCKGSLLKDDPASCLRKISTTFLANSLKFFDKSLQIHSLNVGQQEVNSAIVALEMYQAKVYTKNNYCVMLQSYDEKADCKDVKKLSPAKEDSFNKLAEAVEKSGYIHINDLFFSSNIDHELVQKYYNELLKRSVPILKIYGKHFEQLKGQGGYINTEVAKKLVLSDIERKLSVVHEFNDDDSVSFHACLNLDSKNTIELYPPSIKLYDEQGEHSFVIDDFEQIFKGKKSICGTLENYRPYRYSIKVDTNNEIGSEYPLLIVANGEFKLNTDTSSNYDFKLSKLFDFTAKRSEIESSVSVDYSINDYTYLLNANLIDNRVEAKDVDVYNYNWDIEIPNCEKQDLGDVVVGKNNYKAYIPEECRGSSPTYEVTVYDGQNIVAENSGFLEPMAAGNIEEMKVTVASAINVNNKTWFMPEVKISGGVPPYEITFEADNNILILKNPSTKISRLRSNNSSFSEVQSTLTVLVEDSESKSVRKNITVTIGKNQTLPIANWVNRFMTPFSPKLDKSVGIAIGDSFNQKWVLQNLSNFTLTKAKLKWNSQYSSSTLVHTKNDIYLGDLAPMELAYPELFIEKTSNRGNGVDKGYYNLYYNKNGTDVPVKFPNSTRNVYVNYKFHDKKEVEPAVLGKINSLYPEVATVGNRQTFIVRGTNLPRTIALSIQDCDQGSVTWLSSSSVRYTCTPRATGSKLLYGKMTSGGTSLTNSSTYRVQVSSAVVVDNKPSISITTSGSSSSNNPKTSNFTLSVRATDDKGLKKIAYVLQKTSGGSVLKSGVKNVSGTSANASFSIDVSGLAVGSYKIAVAANDSKNQVSSYRYYYFQKQDTVTLGKITGLSPTTATKNQRETFTISGRNLPRTIALSIQDCDQGSVTWLSSSSARYTCTPRATGSKLLYAKVRSGGTSLTNSSTYRVQVSSAVVVDNKPSISITTSGSSSSNNPKTSNFTLSVRATDDKGLKEINYILQKTSGGSILKQGIKNVSGTSANASFSIDVSGLKVGAYMIKVEVIDSKDQASGYKIYYFQKKTIIPTEETKITNFNISQDRKGSGKLNIGFRVSSGVSLSRIRTYCSTDSSLRTSSQYYYRSINVSASKGSKSTSITENNWLADTVYCKVEVTESNGKKVLSSKAYVHMYKKTLTPPKITNFSLDEVGYGDGKLKATYNISASSSVSYVRLHCSRNYKVKTSSSYDYVLREGSRSAGSGSIEVSHSDWDGEKVYCKIEVFAGTNAYSNVESINLKKKTTYPTEAPRLGRPTVNERRVKTKPKFSWWKADGASRYKIYIKSTDGTHTVSTGRNTGNTYINSPKTLISGKTYEWYVKACDANLKNCISSSKRQFSVR